MKATIVNTVENTTKVVELTDAITDLAGLKHFLNIDEGQFFEGSTHTDLISDTQELPVLPDNKKERGYVFFVSPAQSKIKNGAYSRKECYAIIKDNNLGEAVKSKFGRNFTQVSTDALNGFIADNQAAALSNSSAPAETTHEEAATSEIPTDSADTIDTEKGLFYYIEKALSAAFIQAGMSDNTVKLMSDTIREGIEKVFPNPYSVQDITNMQK